MERNARFTSWDTAHALGFSSLVAVLAVFSGELSAMPLQAQLALVGLGTLVLGIPHGALDLPVARRWLAPRLGWIWAVVFMGAYLVVALPVAVGWALVPGATLGFFLLAGIFHFAASDTEGSGLSPRRRVLEGAARGLTPIAAAAAFWPLEVDRLFAILAGPVAARFLRDVCETLWHLAAVLLLASAALRIMDYLHERPGPLWGFRPSAAKALELACLPLVFLALPPLLAFGVYWVGLHSLHVMLMATASQGGAFTAGLARVYRQAIPATALAFAGAGVLYVLAFNEATAVTAGVAILFMGLAVLNTPHMVFVLVSARYR